MGQLGTTTIMIIMMAIMMELENVRMMQSQQEVLEHQLELEHQVILEHQVVMEEQIVTAAVTTILLLIIMTMQATGDAKGLQLGARGNDHTSNEIHLYI